MDVMGAGVTAVTAAFLINKVFLQYIGPVAVLFIVPLVEETAKTVSALLWGAALVPTHLFFGLVEAVYDVGQGEKRWAAPLLSLAGHALFGGVTHLGVILGGNVLWGWAAGVLLHCLWNGLIINLFRRSHKTR